MPTKNAKIAKSSALEQQKTSTTQRPQLDHRRKSSLSMMEVDSAFLEKLDDFLSNLEKRFDGLEKRFDEYRTMKIDSSLERTYETLTAIRERCGRVGEEVLEGGMRRARTMVDVLETSYKDAIEAKDTFSEKANAGVKFLEDLLADFETSTEECVDRGMSHARHGIEVALDAKVKLAESIEKAILAAKERRLITYAELPNPWRVNEHILKGYRFTETKVDCVLSAFTIHNETCNIWSHALGFTMILAIAFYFYPSSNNFSVSTTADKYINALFFIAAAKALACSTIWHTMSSIAELTTMERFACVDYTGISLLIAASILTTEYTAFYYEPISRSAYMALTLVLGAGGVVLPWQPIFNLAEMRVYRVLFYVTLGATGLLPIFQLGFTRGWSWTGNFYLPILKSIAVYLMGAIVYAAQVPERWRPGFFDWIGGSHNLWHAAVVGGIYFHWTALQKMFQDAFERGVALGY